MTLDQDKKTRHGISNNYTSQLVPIIPPQTPSETDTSKPKQLFELVECQGWIRAGQVIIRASGMSLSEYHDISRAHLWLPNRNDFSPQDIRVNVCYNLLPDTKHVFYMSFPLLLDDQDMTTESISCVYKIRNEHYTSESIPIRYASNTQDTSWLLDSIRV
ncbi:hypothetical protein K501DRAFT_286149, partial [Backusella circina FSU 941]